MNSIYEEGSRVISRDQCAKNAFFSFVVIALFLHIKHGGLLSLWTIKAAIYFLVGIFAASLTIGVLMYFGNRFLEATLFRRHPNTRLIGSTLFVIVLLFLLYKASSFAYFWLHPTEEPVTWAATDHQSASHFQAAKRSSEELWGILGTVGQPGQPQPNVTPAQLRSLLDTAIREAFQVEGSYLFKIHPELPAKYAELFIPSLRGVSEFFRTNNEQTIAEALQKYRRYTDWMNSHYKDFRLIK